jgi:exodeoxyribonuclease VII small subunit
MSKRKAEDGQAGDADSPGFEKSLERLETIVREMESGELSLEKMMAHFEEGQALVKLCSAKLNQVERKVEVLLKEGDKVVAEPFEVEEQGEAEEGGRRKPET